MMPALGSASGRPRRACNHCNSRKVRCDGKKPSCDRCSLLKESCVYGTKKNAAAFRSETVGRLLSSPARSQSELPPVLPSISSSIAISDVTYMGIPPALVSNLIEIYFTHIYNASLLIHKPSFLHAVAEGKTKSHVILSICALASNFHADAAGSTLLRDHGFGNEWADQAGRLVLQEVENPSHENIVTNIALCLYWYGQGAWRKAFVHQSNAMLVSHLLGLMVDNTVNENSLSQEVRRRRFWACYLLNSFSVHTPFPTAPSRQVMSVTLPCREDEYEEMKIPRERDTLKDPFPNGSIYAELVRVMTLWSAVQTLVKDSGPEYTTSLAELHSLDGKIRQWALDIPDNLQMTPISMAEMSPDMLPRLLLLHIVHHQCLCTLHSSIVPLFSWSDSEDNWLSGRQISAQLAFENANAISQFLSGALRWLPDGSRIPSFVGYAAYSACAIQIPFMRCLNTEVKANANINVATNLNIIQWMKPYWKFISLLSVHVGHLYEIHMRNPDPIDDEPRRASANKLSRFKIDVGQARRSILGHNEVLWDLDGGVTRQGEEAADLGIQDTNITSPNSNNISIAAGQSLPEEGISNYDVRPFESLDFFPSYLDSELFNSEAALMAFNQMMASTDNPDPFDTLLRDIQSTASQTVINT